MSPQMIMAIAYLISEAAHTGLSIQAVLKEVEATGVVPPERWDELKAAFDDAMQFWTDEVPPLPPAA